MARYDDLVNKLLKENLMNEDISSMGIGGMMNMSSDNLAPAKGWQYVEQPDEEEETYDEGTLGQVAGAAGGSVLGGPVGAALGSVVGDKVTGEDQEGHAKKRGSKKEIHDKTGHLSDKQLVSRVKRYKPGSVAGYTVDEAEKEIKENGSLSKKMRDAFARDLYERLSKKGKKKAEDENEKSTGRPISKKNPQTKAAAAGKDIGKKGKNFEKIAKSAGKKYGSKAAGDRVAGAILAKMRGK